jgi:hypothetical protein
MLGLIDRPFGGRRWAVAKREALVRLPAAAPTTRRGAARPPFRPVASPSITATSAQVDALNLQRLVGNRVVSGLLGRQAEIAPHDHPGEREAEAAETRATPRVPERPPVRPHMSSQVDEVARRLGAEGFSYRGEVYLSSRHYRPGTASGGRLLAHEMAHATGPAATDGLVHLKRTKKHLDFIRVKKIEARVARGLVADALETMKLNSLADYVQPQEGWGHWWVEVGNLAGPGDRGPWNAVESYGWWPKDSPSMLEALKIRRMEGVLNDGQALDPHHGQKAENDYHPVLEVEDSERYEDVRDRVVGDVRNFAHGFRGSWNWRLGWGKNCHTFVDRLEKRLNVRQGKATAWLAGEGIRPAPPKPKGFDEISKVLGRLGFAGEGRSYFNMNWTDLRGVFTLEEMAALDANGRRDLLSFLNGFQVPTNRVTAEEMNGVLRDVFRADVQLFGAADEVDDLKEMDRPTDGAGTVG